MYVHENNIKNKIRKNYNSCGAELQEFYDDVYLPARRGLDSIAFTDNLTCFTRAAEIINRYLSQIHIFSQRNGITSQSKFSSTFLEEISVYLFKNLPEIVSEELGFFNKKVYAGMKIGADRQIDIITKDVDFCIGKKADISINGGRPVKLILPVVAVEVKTYLDATMFGEIKSSSKAIRSAAPNSKTYVLMGYKDLSDEHIIAARQDSALNEMFVLRENRNSPISAEALHLYWKEIVGAVADIGTEDAICVPGRLLRV